ncbi:MAG: sulfatase-like hydrolase/transferase [Planctomycetota bacterium]|nr:sulfatase-like hydrolase/transferase [Planctomycetota bacterium]
MRCITLMAVLLGCITNGTDAVEQPNVVFILADDLGWSDTTLYGTTQFYETPNIQRLAQRGLLFTNAYTAHPLCSPTRSSIMTGLDPARTGFTSAAGHVVAVNLEKQFVPRARSDQKALTPQSVSRLDTKYTTLAETIKAAGYVTGHFGKWHLGRKPYSPLEHGFDVDVPHWSGPGPAGSYVAPWKFPDGLDFDPTVPDEHIEDRMADEAVAFIEENQDKPFFLNYWAFSVHGPWDGKKELVEKYARKANPADSQRLPVYGAMVESLDDAVGRLLDTLDRLKLANDTIIIFFSDNGGNMYSRIDDLPPTSNAPLRGGKATIYEGGTRVPCAVVWPGTIKAGDTTAALLSSTDWYPTLLEMLQIEKPTGLRFDGVSQVPALKGKTAPRESIVCFVPNYFPRPDTIPSTYIRHGPWKLIRFHADAKQGGDRFELYHLDDDIGETKNIADAHPTRVQQLDDAISAYLNNVDALVPVPNPNYDSKTVPVSDETLRGRLKMSDDWYFLDNGLIRIGVDRSRGAGIGYLSLSTANRNVLNHFDEGRFIQQSYYGKKDGSFWNDKPWNYNPVQGGSWKGVASRVIDFNKHKSAQEIYSRIEPRHWATGAACPEAVMEQWISLKQEVAHVRMKLTYSGKDQMLVRHQEMPAVFVDAALENLVYRDQDELKRRVPQWPNEYGTASSQWFAYLDNQDWGIGIFTPDTTSFTCYRARGDGSNGARGSACSYVAPLRKLSLRPGLVLQYDVYLTLGKLADIERRFAIVRQQRAAVNNPAVVNRPDPATIFRRRDTNKDNFLTLKEYIGNPTGRNVPALTKTFEKRDANHDGRLTLEEMKNQR